MPKSSVIFYEQTCFDDNTVLQLFEYLRTRRFGSKLERLRTLLFIELLAYTGARPCELLAMQYDSIYQDNGGWVTKIAGRKLKGRIRYYNCPQHLVHQFLFYLDARKESNRYEDALFVSMSSFDGWTKSGVDSFFKRLSGEVGFQVSSYPFRRYVATYLNTQGISIQDIGRHLGHLRTSTTERYIERSGALTRDASKVMEFANQFNCTKPNQTKPNQTKPNQTYKRCEI